MRKLYSRTWEWGWECSPSTDGALALLGRLVAEAVLRSFLWCSLCTKYTCISQLLFKPYILYHFYWITVHPISQRK